MKTTVDTGAKNSRINIDAKHVYNLLMSGAEMTRLRAAEMNIQNFVAVRLKLQIKGIKMSKKRVDNNMVAYYMSESDKEHNKKVGLLL